MADLTIPLTKCDKLYQLYAVFSAFAEISKSVNYTITLDSSRLPVNTDRPIPVDTGHLSSDSNITPIYVYWNTTDEGVKNEIANSIKAEADKYGRLGSRGVEEREVVEEVIKNEENEALNDLIKQINNGTKQAPEIGKTDETTAKKDKKSKKEKEPEKLEPNEVEPNKVEPNEVEPETEDDSDTDNAPNFTTEENQDDSDQEQVNTDNDNDTKQPPEMA